MKPWTQLNQHAFQTAVKIALCPANSKISMQKIKAKIFEFSNSVGPGRSRANNLIQVKQERQMSMISRWVLIDSESSCQTIHWFG